jgi:hypothetical protein
MGKREKRLGRWSYDVSEPGAELYGAGHWFEVVH